MKQNAIAKAIARGTVVSWREEPTQYDIEALRANVERVGLVIRVRWAIVAILAVFSVVAAAVYGTSTEIDVLVKNMTVPAIALVFVLLYNSFYQLTYRRASNIVFLNFAQLLFDIVVVTVLVYYSGGVYSWFSSMYVIFILESAFILSERVQVWALAVTASVLYALVLFGEYLGWISHVDLPFVANELHTNLTYVLVRYLWMVTLYAGSALIGMLMMRSIRRRERELQECSFVDELTGLYNRAYFQRVLATELERARHNGRELALVVADVDGLGSVNRTFGVEVGDGILAALGRHLQDVGLRGRGDGDWLRAMNAACRIGGEEFALLMPEAGGEMADVSIEDRVLAIAEAFRHAAESTRVSGVGVTVSVAAVIGPRDGESTDALIDAADSLLAFAATSGGNTVCASWLMRDGSDAGE